jgi:hypothetical protein
VIVVSHASRLGSIVVCFTSASIRRDTVTVYAAFPPKT